MLIKSLRYLIKIKIKKKLRTLLPFAKHVKFIDLHVPRIVENVIIVYLFVITIVLSLITVLVKETIGY